MSVDPVCSKADLDHVMEHTRALWEALRGERVFVTGGTGFFGCWLLASFCRANRELGLGAKITVLTRTPEAFRRRAPSLVDDPAVSLLQGDVTSFSIPRGNYAFMIHAAADYAQGGGGALAGLHASMDGTRRLLEFSLQSGARRMLYVSSGAVYGAQPPEVAQVPENFEGAPDPLLGSSAYGEGKRVAEALCALHTAGSSIDCTIARCFAFLGPHLPLDAQYAAGNFIRDALAGKPIEIQGDGTPVRSYLYAADLAIWLWRILFRGTPLRAYNVGSEEAINIFDLAHAVRRAICPEVRIAVLRQPIEGVPPLRYVPSTRRAREELQLEQWIGLEEGLRRTAAWHRDRA